MPDGKFEILAGQAASLAETDPFYVPLLSNVAALLWDSLEGPSGKINWAGFYIMRGGMLVLGPFQGKSACIHIAPGKGVCGAAAAESKTLVVPDVHEFPGHIACDSASRSEIVAPVIGADGQVKAVIDIDSPEPGHFTKEHKEALEALAGVLGRVTLWE